MRLVIQRVSEASVVIDNKVHNSINKGLLLLLGIEDADEYNDIDWLCNKVANMRIFSDEKNKMNLSIKDIIGEVMIISQFTLYASTKKGNRPSFIRAAKAEKAKRLYEEFINHFKLVSGLEVKTGIFAADMKVTLNNDGPVTIIIDSKNKE